MPFQKGEHECVHAGIKGILIVYIYKSKDFNQPDIDF